MKIPLYSTDLIAQLDEAFPEKCPDIKDSERTIWKYAGMRELVRVLKSSLKDGSEPGELPTVLGKKA